MTTIIALVKNFSIDSLAALGYRRPIFNRAKRAARKAGKPLLNAGCGTAYTEASDVNLDIIPREGCKYSQDVAASDITGVTYR